MGKYLSPGVYMEEKSSGAKPIEGAGTSTGAFVGIAEMGPVNKAKLVTSWSKFVEIFGNFVPNAYLAYSVFQFFNEGGTKCYVVRVADSDAAKSSVIIQDRAGTPVDTLKVAALSEGVFGDKISVIVEDLDAVSDPEGKYFKLKVKYDGEIVEDYDLLSMAETDANGNPNLNHVELRINGTSQWIEVEDLASSSSAPADKPALSVAGYALAGGDNGISNLQNSDYYGNEADLNGLHAFDPIDEVNILAIPDAAGIPDVIAQAVAYCENRKDCFFVADSTLAMDHDGIKTLRSQIFSSFGALYYPWIEVSDSLTGKRIFTPPSGAVVGTYSHTDVVRGVHKAPAGTQEGYLNSALGLKIMVTKGGQDELNPLGINVVRNMPGAGICVWGACTLTSDPEWKYINVRRLFLFLEESILKATQWVVFEPNDPKLWGSVKRNITAFLTRVWRDGALFGATADEAFFVKVDEENNPPEVQDAGQLIIEIGCAPVKPAEFVIIRISQKTLTK